MGEDEADAEAEAEDEAEGVTSHLVGIKDV